MRSAADGDCVPGGDGDGGHDDRRPRPRHGRDQHPAADQETVRFRHKTQPEPLKSTELCLQQHQ